MRECFAKRSEKVVDRIYLFRKGKDLAAGVGHQASKFEVLAAADVEFGPVAAFPAGGETLGESAVGEFLERGVDPTEAEGFFDYFQIGDSSGAGEFGSVAADPAMAGDCVIGLEPLAQL